MSTIKHTFCRICSPCCPLVAEIGDDGEIKDLRPDREHPVSKGYACNKGLAYLDIHHDPDRLSGPLRRVSADRAPMGAFEAVSWDHALHDIGKRLRDIRERYGSDALGIYGGNPIAFNSKAFGAVYSMAARLGLTRSFNAGTQDLSNKFAASEAVFGGWVFPLADFYKTKYLLCFGSNPKVSRWTMASVNRPEDAMRNIAARGGKIRFINPRRVESASSATGDVIQIKPDTDVYFIAALINEIDRVGGFKDEVIAKHGKHIEDLRAFVRLYTPDRVAGVTGVDADTIRTVAREFMEAEGASTHHATGINQSRQGTLASWLLHMLVFVTGNLGREGGEYLPKGYCTKPFALPPSDDRFVQTEFGRMRHVFFALPGTLLADFIELEENPIRALIVFSGNPLLSIGGEERLRKAFSKLELLVVVDIVRNTTAEYADYILAAADWLEREDVNATSNGAQVTPYAQHTDAVVQPHFDRKDDWWIVARLEQELGLPSILDRNDPDPMAEQKGMLAVSNLTIEQLRAAPHHTILLPQPDRETFYNDAVMTEDGKVDCCPPSFAEALKRSEALFLELDAEPHDQLKLISLRTNYMHNGSLSNAKTLKRGKGASNPLHLHPADAEARGLAEGDVARIFNAFGNVVTPITLDATLRPGVVALSHGYGHVQSPGTRVAQATCGVNANRLMPTGPGSFEPLSNMSHLTGVPVEVEKIHDNGRLAHATTPERRTAETENA